MSARFDGSCRGDAVSEVDKAACTVSLTEFVEGDEAHDVCGRRAPFGPTDVYMYT